MTGSTKKEWVVPQTLLMKANLAATHSYFLNIMSWTYDKRNSL